MKARPLITMAMVPESADTPGQLRRWRRDAIIRLAARHGFSARVIADAMDMAHVSVCRIIAATPGRDPEGIA